MAEEDARTPSTAPKADPAFTEKVRDDAQGAFRRVRFFLGNGDPERALFALEPLVARLDELGAKEPDSDRYSFDFSGPEQAYLYVLRHPDTPVGLMHSTVGPYVDAYGIQAAILYQLGRYHEAVDAIDKALAWNPTDGGLYLERAMAHEAAREYALLEQDIEAAYPLITTAVDLARYHALRADVLVSQAKYDLAAAHYAVYHDFDPDDTYALPDQELHELGHRTGRGHAYSRLTSGEAQRRLRRAGEKYGPSEEAVAVLRQIARDATDLGDSDAARTAAQRLRELVHDKG